MYFDQVAFRGVSQGKRVGARDKVVTDELFGPSLFGWESEF
jgi:hypothetical protein